MVLLQLLSQIRFFRSSRIIPILSVSLILTGLITVSRIDAIQTQHNVNISGGTDRMRYFVSAGAFTQDGLFKQQSLPYDFNFKYQRFNYRANLDFDVTKTTTISVNLGAR